MNRWMLAALVLPLGACEVPDVAGIWGGLTSSLVAEGVILSVAPPDTNMDLSGSGFDSGMGFTAFLADAAQVADLANAPITGATVSLHGVAADDQGEGVYTYAGTDLTYAEGETWQVKVDLAGDVATASVTLPPTVTVTIPQQHDANADLTVALAGQDYATALVVVYDLQAKAVTFSNEPKSISEVYQFTRGDAVEDIIIPGSAFAASSVYAVGVAGLNHTTAADLDQMNSALSSIMAGQMKFYPVSTMVLP